MRSMLVRRLSHRSVKYAVGKLKTLESVRKTTAVLTILESGKLLNLVLTDPTVDVPEAEIKEMLPYAKDFKGSYPELEELELKRSYEVPELREVVESVNDFIGSLREYMSDLRLDLKLNIYQIDASLHRDGRKASYTTGAWSLEGAVIKVLQDELLEFYLYHISSEWKEGLRPLAESPYFRGALELLRMERAEELPEAKLPVVLTPPVSFLIALAMTEGLNGDNLYRQVSPLKPQRELPFKVSLMDEPELGLLTGWRPVDDEGVRTSKKVLIDEGVVRDYLATVEISEKLKEELNLEVSPGNALFKGSDFHPSPSTLTFSVPEVKLRDLGRHIRVFANVGGGQSNLLAGDIRFQVSLAGLYHGDELISRLRPFPFSLNLYEDLKELYSDNDWLMRIAFGAGELLVPALILMR